MPAKVRVVKCRALNSSPPVLSWQLGPAQNPVMAACA